MIMRTAHNLAGEPVVVVAVVSLLTTLLHQVVVLQVLPLRLQAPQVLLPVHLVVQVLVVLQVQALLLIDEDRLPVLVEDQISVEIM